MLTVMLEAKFGVNDAKLNEATKILRYKGLNPEHIAAVLFNERIPERDAEFFRRNGVTVFVEDSEGQFSVQVYGDTRLREFIKSKESE